MPAYQRLDLGAPLLAKKQQNTKAAGIFLSTMHMANQIHIQSFFQSDPKDANKTQVVQTTLFKMVPAVTYNFKF